MSLVVKTEPTAEPISTAEAKTQLYISTTDHDTKIAQLITAARLNFENRVRLSLFARTYTWKLNAFPKSRLRFPRPPLSSVTSIKYKAAGTGTLTTWTSTLYITDTESWPGLVYPAYGESWPSIYGEGQDVQIEYIAGYTNAAAVPEHYNLALMEIVAHHFINREPILIGDTGAKAMHIPESALRMIRAERDFRFDDGEGEDG